MARTCYGGAPAPCLPWTGEAHSPLPSCTLHGALRRPQRTHAGPSRVACGQVLQRLPAGHCIRSAWHSQCPPLRGAVTCCFLYAPVCCRSANRLYCACACGTQPMRMHDAAARRRCSSDAWPQRRRSSHAWPHRSPPQGPTSPETSCHKDTGVSFRERDTVTGAAHTAQWQAGGSAAAAAPPARAPRG